MRFPEFGGWTPWLVLAAIGGLLMTGLLVTDPKTPKTAHNLQTTFYPEPVAHEGFSLSKERISERNVSAYLLSAKGVGDAKRPVVILIHGGAMTDVLEFSTPQYKGEWFIPRYEHVPYRLAESGFLVIAIDAWWAGERFQAKHAEMAQRDPMASIFHGWVETRMDVSSIIDYLAGRPDVDLSRIAVAGWSGGGITSLMAIAKDKRVRAALAWKAGPDFTTKIHLRGQSFLAEDALASNASFIEELHREDAIYHYQDIPPRPVALIGNLEDPAMPRHLAEHFVEILRPFYREHPERLLLSLYKTPKPTHDLAREPLVEGCEWLIRMIEDPVSD